METQFPHHSMPVCDSERYAGHVRNSQTVTRPPRLSSVLSHHIGEPEKAGIEVSNSGPKPVLKITACPQENAPFQPHGVPGEEPMESAGTPSQRRLFSQRGDEAFLRVKAADSRNPPQTDRASDHPCVCICGTYVLPRFCRQTQGPKAQPGPAETGGRRRLLCAPHTHSSSV